MIPRDCMGIELIHWIDRLGNGLSPFTADKDEKLIGRCRYSGDMSVMFVEHWKGDVLMRTYNVDDIAQINFKADCTPQPTGRKGYCGEGDCTTCNDDECDQVHFATTKTEKGASDE